MAANLAIDVHGLTKRFGEKIAVDAIDIAVPYGEVWGFLGPNGSGKTTTIRMLCGLLHPDAGDGTCLDLATRELARQTGLERAGAASKQAYDQAKSARDTAAALVAQIKAGEDQARATLANAA